MFALGIAFMIACVFSAAVAPAWVTFALGVLSACCVSFGA